MLTHAATLHVRFAETDADVRAAQELRYQVFIKELGGTGKAELLGEDRDVDKYDTVAKHLLLCDGARVVGAYRLIDADGADAVGGFYSENEYDLSALRNSGRRLLELGRSCIHPDYRNGLGLMQLWRALATYVKQHDYEILFGVASFHGADAAKHKLALAHLQANYLADAELRPVSRSPVEMSAVALTPAERKAAIGMLPGLIKSYLRLGGKVGDGAYCDRAFNTTDVCLLLDTADLNARAAILLPEDPA